MTTFTLPGIFILAYALGNFSPAYLFSKWFGGFDIRERGSGNAGATNVVREMGWRFGAIVFILDILKGLGAVAIGFWLGGSQGIAAAAFGVVLGHDFPVVLSFRGGKGVAATTGILLSLFPLPTLIGIITFVLVVVLTRMVSLGSLIFVTGMAAYTLISGQPSALAVAVVGIAVFAILRHRSNIQRILNGTENLVSF
jgi:glycerol-3-phosphate acyltransferase PlsY